MRKTISTEEFEEFFLAQSAPVRKKLGYSIDAVRTLTKINTKLVKKLVNTYFYELRVSMDNEYRVILLAADHDDINQAKTVYFLNGFVKKSTKDYKKQLVIAKNIINKLEL